MTLGYVYFKPSEKKTEEKEIVRNEVLASSLKILNKNKTLEYGETLTLDVTGTYDKKVTYQSNHTDIATVDENGVIHTKRPGKVKITVSSSQDDKDSMNLTITNNKGFITEKQLQEIDLNGYDNLMIVAHPDDETLWGGAHLLQGKWFVVCLTNKNNKVRKKEFENIIDYSNNRGLILSYPDKMNNKKDDWSYVKKGIDKDISTLLKYKKWKKIVTHNPDGEYGHIHHKMTDQMVTKETKNNKVFNKLYYFGKYYSKSNKSKNHGKKISSNLLNKKNQMINMFPSQMKAINKYWTQMIPYENWVKASNW